MMDKTNPEKAVKARFGSDLDMARKGYDFDITGRAF